MKLSTVLLAAMAIQMLSVAEAQQPQPRMATKPEYAICLEAQDSIAQRATSLAKRHEDRTAWALRLQTADESLNAQVKRHAPKTKDEIASYNRAVERRNLSVKDFNDRGKELEREQEALNASIYRHNEACGSLLVPVDVKEEVEQERKARGTKQ